MCTRNLHNAVKPVEPPTADGLSKSCLPAVLLMWLATMLWASMAMADKTQSPNTMNLPPIVLADGTGLPEGSGTAREGEKIYSQQCASCHGRQGEGGRAIELVGERERLASEYPDRGIAVFWPNAPALFDYVRRAMPPDAPWSLSADDTYAVVAHLLELNDLLGANGSASAATLSTLTMPNKDGFIDFVSQ